VATLAQKWKEGHLLLRGRGHRPEVYSKGGWYIRGKGRILVNPWGVLERTVEGIGTCGTQRGFEGKG